MTSGLRIVAVNAFPPAYGLVAGWATDVILVDAPEAA